jgi:hypothetical protein
MLRAAARRHRLQFEKYVASVGDPNVVIRQPAVRTAGTTDADLVLGRRADAIQGEGYGESRTVTAIVTDAAMATNDEYAKIPPHIAAIGKTDTLDLILRCNLSDVLISPTDRYGKTLFHTAKEVVIGGAAFQVRATDRTGLPPEGPYVFWVALRAVGE